MKSPRSHHLALSVLPLLLALAPISRAATYDVGPDAGQLIHLSDVPWGYLQPGDIVNIHAKPGGYHEIIQVSAAGTAAAPILIRGIPDPVTHALPVIDGDNAVMDPHVNFRSPVFEPWGLIIVSPRASGYVYGKTFPAYITIESLDLRNALYDPSGVRHFTDQHGATRIFDHFACGIYIEFAHHLTVRGCEISFNGNGIFANSKNGPAQSSADLLIEGNYLHDNGQPAIAGQTNGYAEHNIYIESVGAVYQFNRFGPLRAGCHGCMIKDRSSGTVIRYNEVASNENSEIFAILDPQGGSGWIDQQPDYRDAFVYGNLITFQNSGFSGGNVVWFAACNGAKYYAQLHRGTLYFYHNTVVVHQKGTSAFFLTDPVYSGSPAVLEKVDARNNIFYTDSSIQSSVYYAFHFAVSNAITTIDLGLNWVSPLTQANWYGHGSATTVTGWSNLTIGDYAGKNNPNFVSIATADYNLTGGSDAIDAAGPLAAAAIAKGYLIDQAYAGPQSSVARAVLGLNADLGALETSTTYVAPAANHAPLAGTFSLNLVNGATVPFKLPGTDADGDPLSYTIVTPPIAGKVQGLAPNLYYTAPPTSNGSTALAYSVSDGLATSATGYIYIAVNPVGSSVPAVTLTSPATTVTLSAPATLTLSATASAANGITKVDFFSGFTKLGGATTAPYSFTWTNIAPGTYHVVAKAFDPLGARTFSQPVTVIVK